MDIFVHEKSKKLQALKCDLSMKEDTNFSFSCLIVQYISIYHRKSEYFFENLITASINILTMQTKTEKKQERTGRRKTDRGNKEKRH